MKWDYWFLLFLEKYCVGQGLRPLTIAAYRATLERFKRWAQARLGVDIQPDQIKVKDILTFIEYLRFECNNQHAAVNTQVVTLRTFYRAMVSLDQIEPRNNPTLLLPKLKPPKRKIKDILSQDEVGELLNFPNTHTILGLHDRAILTLLYGTGIRASECAGITESDVDLIAKTVRVCGKGGHQRMIPLNETVVKVLEIYREHRGKLESTQAFFRSRKRRGASRGVIYDRVRKIARKAKLTKRVTPHLLRHTFATHLIRLGEKLIVLKELLGHRVLASTQVYLHLTGEDLRSAVEKHPVGKLLNSIGDFLPKNKLPFQHPPGTRFAFNRF